LTATPPSSWLATPTAPPSTASSAPGDAAIGGLVDGQTYYAIVASGNTTSFQVASQKNGTPINLNTSNLTGGTTHWFGPQSIDLSESSGTQQLRINLTGDSGSGTQTIVGPGGISLAMLAPPPGDGVSTASSTGSGGGFVGVNENSANATASADVSAYIAADSMSVRASSSPRPTTASSSPKSTTS
jgi:hypothetical protein